MSWLWRAMYPISMPLLRIGLRIRVVGRENVPATGAAIFASNHLSALDHVVLPAVTRRPIVFLSKAEHFHKPIKRWFFKGWNIIPIQRGAGDDAALEAARNALRAGNLFGIYPEGTRSMDGKLHKGHSGVARLALEMRVPVIPVAMIGTFEAMPKGGKLKLFRPTAAVVGKPMDLSAQWGKQGDRAICRQVTNEVMAAIRELSGQEYVDEYQFNPEVTSHSRPGEQPTGDRPAAATGGSSSADRAGAAPGAAGSTPKKSRPARPKKAD